MLHPPTHTAIAADHDHQIPAWPAAAASTTISIIFSTAKEVFSAGTPPGRATATSALSCMTKIAHSIVASTNPTAENPGCNRSDRSSGDHTLRPNRNTTATTPDSPPPTR